MSTDDTRLRGNKNRLQSAWALGSLPRKVITGIGKQLVHRLAVGHSDITGDDFGTIIDLLGNITEDNLPSKGIFQARR